VAEIKDWGFVRHLRAEPSSHVLRYKRGKLRASGRGLAFWFGPMTAGIAELPVDDREVALTLAARSVDFQDVTVQGVVTYRVSDPVALAERVDFAIDTRTGLHRKQPLDQIELHVSQLAQERAAEWIATRPLREVLRDGPREVRERVLEALTELGALGLATTSVRVANVTPSRDLERALEAPMRERIQQEADEAAFARRALAVEKERAIQENELQNQIELAKREELLIAQKGTNDKRTATDAVESKRIAAEGDAARVRTQAEAQAAALELVEGAKVEQERKRMDIARSAPPVVLAALAAKELAGKLSRIDHLHVGGDTLGPLLTELVTAGTRRLEKGESGREG